MKNFKRLSVVVSVYNEEESLEIFWDNLKEALILLDISYEVIFVNDGSFDGSAEILQSIARGNKSAKIINFSTNFGHEAAMTAGLEYSKGDAVICMDADLQHPPLEIDRMLKKFNDGYEIINMVRKKNLDVGFFKNLIIKIFYILLNMLSSIKFQPNASDFFLVSRRVADILTRDFCERTRFLRGLIQIVGFNKTTIEYIAPKRISGKSKYSMIKLFSNALIAIATFSNLPLRIGVFFGTLMGMFGICVAIYSIIMKFSGYVTPGYTTTVVLISFLFAVQFFITGVIGEYIGFLFNESKKRPIYIVKNTINIKEETQDANQKYNQ